MPTEELLLFISTFLMIKTFKFSIRCKIHIVCASFLEKKCHSYNDHCNFIFLTIVEKKPSKSDDCGAPIQNTTAELLTISQLLVKDAYRPEPKPMADFLICLEYPPLFSVVVFVCVMKTISLLASETASFAVVL